MINPKINENFKKEFLIFRTSVLIINKFFNNIDNAIDAKIIMDKEANTSNRTNAELT